MENPDPKIGQNHPQRIIILSALLFTLLMAGMVILKVTMDWPQGNLETLILVYIMAVSILPVVLYLLHFLSEKGGSLEYKGIKLNFAQVAANNALRFKVPGNIGISGQAIYNSSSTQILDALKKAAACDVMVVDLELGKSWWETRLLVLLAGAVRHLKPAKIVFTATEGTTEDVFLGWSHPYELLPLLLKAHPKYPMIYHKVLAAVKQWELIELNGDSTKPGELPSLQPIAKEYERMAKDQDLGIPNLFSAEQLFITLLIEEIEHNEPPREITIVRLNELFPILRKEVIDNSWDIKEQMKVFFDTSEDYLALTEKRKFSCIVSRLSLISEMMKSLVQ